MRRSRLLIGVLASAAVLAAPATTLGATPPPDPSSLEYADGAEGRYPLAGRWLFRLDPADTGVADGLPGSTGTRGWSRVAVPYAWNAQDDSEESFIGGVAWYRKDFRLPDDASALSWVVRFESVNRLANVWLNGKPIGSHEGEFLPFELPLKALRREGVNRLVVRVDSRHDRFDLPPYRVNDDNLSPAGWWNDGGIIREVYLRRIDRVDLTDPLVRPIVRGRPRGPVRVEQAITAVNVTSRPQRVTVRATYGDLERVLGTRRIGPRGRATFTGSVVVRRPKLWAPGKPNLYPARFTATVGDEDAEAAAHSLQSGIRSIEVEDGLLLVNGRRYDPRGVGIHEASRERGFAIDSAYREALVDDAKEIGATLLRTHYPLHPQTQELADRAGIMIWSEIPMYHLREEDMVPAVRREAIGDLQENVLLNRNHPSVLTFSLGNELPATVEANQARYLRDGAAAVRALDPTRPVSFAINGYIGQPCQAAYSALDYIGLNDYFGWYESAGGGLADRDNLGPYLDEARACYPRQALAVTEFGAEANRSGPVEEKGTFEFQQDFVRFHLATFETKPWLSGGVYWALREFRVRPRWNGGNSRPNPPVHEKGLVTWAGARKPAFADTQQLFRAAKQYPAR